MSVISKPYISVNNTDMPLAVGSSQVVSEYNEIGDQYIKVSIPIRDISKDNNCIPSDSNDNISKQIMKYVEDIDDANNFYLFACY